MKRHYTGGPHTAGGRPYGRTLRRAMSRGLAAAFGLALVLVAASVAELQAKGYSYVKTG